MIISKNFKKFQFGIHNPDYPAQIKRKAFILDYDAYHQGILNIQDLSTSVDEYHNVIQHVFEDNITENLRALLNG